MTFEELFGRVEALSELESVGTSIIGHSVLGKPIYTFHVGGYGKNQIIITGAIHAREWITALLIVELVEIYSSEIFESCGIYFLPLCNPDGVEMALGGEVLWKANACGVDLNVNFDADWGAGKHNVQYAGPENFIGSCPNSEPEVKALVDFTKHIQPEITIAYHSKGEVIYYGFESGSGVKNRRLLSRVKAIAKRIGRLTGYKPVKTRNSTGGYSDWVLMHLNVPALTIEVGSDKYLHPIGVEKLPEILDQNRNVPQALLDILCENGNLDCR